MHCSPFEVLDLQWQADLHPVTVGFNTTVFFFFHYHIVQAEA